MVSPWAVRAASAAALLLVSASAQLPVASPQPIQYVGWIYTGCTTATTELDKFDPIPFTAPIDVEDCIAACETDSYVYSVLYGGLCACGKATDLLAPVKYNTDNSLCNFACPKNSSEACGGSGNVDTELTLSYSFYSKVGSAPTNMTSPKNVTTSPPIVYTGGAAAQKITTTRESFGVLSLLLALAIF